MLKLTSKFIFLISLIFFVGCDEDENRFDIVITNPYDYSVKVQSSSIEQTVISANSEQTLSGDEGEHTLSAVDAQCFDECSLLGEQGNYSTSNTIFYFEADKTYYWTVGSNTLGTDSSVSAGSLVGRWVNLSGCVTQGNDQAYFQFDSDGSGKIFNADCNSSCAGYGYFLNFNWINNGTTVTLNYTSVSEYCGVQVAVPQADTLSYSISGNQLTIGGATWTKS